MTEVFDFETLTISVDLWDDGDIVEFKAHLLPIPKDSWECFSDDDSFWKGKLLIVTKEQENYDLYLEAIAPVDSRPEYYTCL